MLAWLWAGECSVWIMYRRNLVEESAGGTGREDASGTGGGTRGGTDSGTSSGAANLPINSGKRHSFAVIVFITLLITVIDWLCVLSGRPPAAGRAGRQAPGGGCSGYNLDVLWRMFSGFLSPRYSPGRRKTAELPPLPWPGRSPARSLPSRGSRLSRR